MGDGVAAQAYADLMAFATPLGYTVDDLDWLRAEIGIAHLELDPWGSLIVSPATAEHEQALALLVDQIVTQLQLPGCVRVNSLAWKIPGGSGYVNVPDLAVVSPGCVRVGVSHLDPPPLLVIEVASPSTRAVDRGRKLADYRLGGACLYLLIDLPGLSTVAAVTFELHDFVADAVRTAMHTIELVVDERPLRLDLSSAGDVRPA
ncbi:MAG: Uma2 family endonuclease [Acidimicrobiales bacterium]